MKPSLYVDPSTLAHATKALQAFPGRLRFKHARIALLAGGGVFKDAALKRAPKQFGGLQRNMRVRVIIPDASYNTAHHGKPARTIIGIRRRALELKRRTAKGWKRRGSHSAIEVTDRSQRPSRYIHLIENPTKRHVIAVENQAARTLRQEAAKDSGRPGMFDANEIARHVMSDTYRIYGTRVNHPGTRGTHFMNNAFNAALPSALDKIKRKLAEGSDQVAKELASTQSSRS